jgi:hypothetical protein
MAKTSDGQTWSQDKINRLLAKAHERIMLNNLYRSRKCHACYIRPINDFDHTISQKRCKYIQKTELIVDPDNIVTNCRQCHQQWEIPNNPAWLDHFNAVKRLRYHIKHDLEGAIPYLLTANQQIESGQRVRNRVKIIELINTYL